MDSCVSPSPIDATARDEKSRDARGRGTATAPTAIVDTTRERAGCGAHAHCEPVRPGTARVGRLASRSVALERTSVTPWFLSRKHEKP